MADEPSRLLVTSCKEYKALPSDPIYDTRRNKLSSCILGQLRAVLLSVRDATSENNKKVPVFDGDARQSFLSDVVELIDPIDDTESYASVFNDLSFDFVSVLARGAAHDFSEDDRHPSFNEVLEISGLNLEPKDLIMAIIERLLTIQTFDNADGSPLELIPLLRILITASQRLRSKKWFNTLQPCLEKIVSFVEHFRGAELSSWEAIEVLRLILDLVEVVFERKSTMETTKKDAPPIYSEVCTLLTVSLANLSTSLPLYLVPVINAYFAKYPQREHSRQTLEESDASDEYLELVKKLDNIIKENDLERSISDLLDLSGLERSFQKSLNFEETNTKMRNKHNNSTSSPSNSLSALGSFIIIILIQSHSADTKNSSKKSLKIPPVSDSMLSLIVTGINQGPLAISCVLQWFYQTFYKDNNSLPNKMHISKTVKVLAELSGTCEYPAVRDLSHQLIQHVITCRCDDNEGLQLHLLQSIIDESTLPNVRGSGWRILKDVIKTKLDNNDPSTSLTQTLFPSLKYPFQLGYNGEKLNLEHMTESQFISESYLSECLDKLSCLYFIITRDRERNITLIHDNESINQIKQGLVHELKKGIDHWRKEDGDRHAKDDPLDINVLVCAVDRLEQAIQE